MSELIGDDIKAVLFDHDDTLVGTIEAKWAAHKHVAKTHYNKELLDEEIRQHWGKPLSTLVGLLYETNDIDTALKREMATHPDFPKRLFESTIGVLERIRQLGKFVGLVTATSRRSFVYDLDTLGIPLALFDYTHTEDDAVFHKPDSRVFEPAKQWLAQHDIVAEEAMYVGDGLHDKRAAEDAGFNFVGVATGLVTVEEFRKAGAKAVASLEDLLPK